MKYIDSIDWLHNFPTSDSKIYAGAYPSDLNPKRNTNNIILLLFTCNTNKVGFRHNFFWKNAAVFPTVF